MLRGIIVILLIKEYNSLINVYLRFMPKTKQKSGSSKFRLRWFLPFVAALMPIILLSFYTYRVASESIQDLVHAENLSATSDVAQLLTQDITNTVGLMYAVASVPGTVGAVEKQDVIALISRMRALVIADPKIEQAFVTDAEGRLIAGHPTIEHEKEFSDSEWFKSVIKTNKPVLSGVAYGTNSKKSVVPISVPIFNGEDDIIGILTFEYGTSHIVESLKNLKLTHGGNVFVVDQNNILVAHPDAGSNKKWKGDISKFIQAEGVIYTVEHVDPLMKKEMLATFLPINIGSNAWVIVAQQPTEAAYASLRRLRFNIGIAGGFLTLLTFVLVIGLARMSSRIQHLNVELTDKNIKLSETASIVRSSNDAIISLTKDGTIRSWNEAANKIYGFSEEEIIGKQMSLIVPEDKMAEHKDMMPKLLSGEAVQDFETVHIGKDKNEVPVSVTLSPVENERGKVIGVSATCRDITHRKEMQQMKDDFIGFVSHQLKAPISALKWTLEMIGDGDYGKVPETLKEPLSSMNEVVSQNSHLVGQILNASRIDRGVIEVETKPISLKAIAERAVRDYKIPIEQKGLELKLVGFDQNIMVEADEEKSAEAVKNSISNAVKHTEKGSITVEIKSENGFGIVTVTDTGEGMEKEMLERLFSRNKVKGKNTAAAGSSGLGLFIAKKFMELQKGDIMVTSELGKGTVFSYRLPLAK